MSQKASVGWVRAHWLGMTVRVRENGVGPPGPTRGRDLKRPGRVQGSRPAAREVAG
jgi:hypothetical protein